MQVRIKFKAHGANSVIGGFSSGDIARVDAEFARHLVEEAKVAEYVQEAKAEDNQETKPARKVKDKK
jgi:phosphoribosylformylglycinamidine (FGAM) synthase-like amidotransferase family enzyme